MCEYDLSLYLGGKEPICREERQYAAFLYSIFLQAKNDKDNLSSESQNVINNCLNISCLENIEIIDVYFEAAILRDFHKQFRNGFNKGLFKFADIDNDINSLKENARSIMYEHNLGETTAVKTINNIDNQEIKRKALLLSKMMNAKPDLLVIYSDGEIINARILECKYKSGAGKYKDDEGSETINQELVQECILAFLFGSRFKNEKSAESHIIEKYLPHKNQSPQQEKWKERYLDLFKKMLANKDLLFKYTDKRIINNGVKEINFSEETYSTSKLISTVYNKANRT